jgi:DNA-binding transcriptional MocR family regulator
MWHPTLRKGTKPIYEQLIEGLEHDVAKGVLSPGHQLPPQRDLAYRLKIGVGTVTKVYAEARRRGLLTATVGRGSFIAGPSDEATKADGDRMIDFSRNLSPTAAAATHLAETLSTLRRRGDLTDHLSYAPPAGMTAHRQAAAKWLASSAGFTADWQRLVICGGGQQAMTLAFAALCKAGDTVMTESATFFGMRALADQLGIRLQGLKMDAQGLTPEALDRAAASGAKILYTIPALQNPTGRIMGAKRRADIAAIARKRDLIVVEDDVYTPFVRGEHDLPALATLIPERTFYIATLSKVIAPGLRCGYLLAPNDEHLDRVIRAVRAFSYAPAAFGALIGTQWIEDGIAQTIAAGVKREIALRTELAAKILGKAIEGPHAKVSPHVWLPMSELTAERVAGAALRAGVSVTPPSAPIVDATEISGLRLCIGAPRDMTTLERGLKIVADALTGTPDTARAVV